MTKTSFLALPILAIAVSASAQGDPKVPADVMAKFQVEKAAANKLEDEAWQSALPEVEAWAKKGKPYLSGAAKPEDLPQAKIPAFPGAWGGGMYSFGGRGGKVLVVTNLKDRGPGSFREACESGGPRTIVFNVAGLIRIRAPYVTIAGNTVELNTHDVILRYLRFRRGKTDPVDRDDSLGGNPVGIIMIGVSWAAANCVLWNCTASVIWVETELDAEEQIKLLDEVGSPAIKIYYNLANAIQQQRNFVKELLRLGKDRICQIHFSNQDGVWLKNGSAVNVQNIKSALDEMGWSGWLVIERSRDARNSRDVKGNYGANARNLRSIFQNP